MKKVTIILLLCLGVFSTQTYAKNKQEKIHELVQLMQPDSVPTKMINSILPMVMGNKLQKLDSAQRAKVMMTFDKIKVAVQGMMVKLNEDKAQLYDQYFTERDINKMLRFYKSRTGRKYVNAQPEIIKALAIKAIKVYLPELKESLKGEKK